MSGELRMGQTLYHNGEEGVWFPKDVVNTLYRNLQNASNVSEVEGDDSYDAESAFCPICRGRRQWYTEGEVYDDEGELIEAGSEVLSEQIEHIGYCAVIDWPWLHTLFPQDPHYQNEVRQPLLMSDEQEVTTE